MLIKNRWITEFCKKTQLFFIVNKHYKNSQQIIAKSGLSEGRPVITGKPEIRHPVEDIVKNRLEMMLDADLPEVTLHRGGNNQEILKARGAIALAGANDIYIREEAYKEGSMLTDAILLHEMMHIIQKKNKVKMATGAEIKKAEEEAVEAEHISGEIFDPDPVEIIEYNGVRARLRRSQRKNIIHDTVDKLIKWVEKQKMMLDEEQYLRFLANLDNYRKTDYYLKQAKTPGEALYNEIEYELKSRFNGHWG